MRERQKTGARSLQSGSDENSEPWSALLSAWRDWGVRTELENHVLLNGYANGWMVDPAVVENKQSFDIVLEYKPQRIFEIGLLVSLATLIACVGYLCYQYGWLRIDANY